MKKKINIGLFGYGCVGQGFYKALKQSSNSIAEIKKIVVKDKYKKRDLPENQFYYQASDILIDEDIDTVVELIDDANAAYDIVNTAFNQGKNVVSANKKLIAEHLDELLELADQNHVSFLYEASVCASIPIIRNLEDYFKSDIIEGFQGICNGTTNYILSRTAQGLTYDKALQEAQELGFAETDPTLDVDGFDAKYKLIILLKHAFGISEQPQDIFNCGIRHIKPSHVRFTQHQGGKLKLYSYAKQIEDKVIGLVAPFFVPKSHPNYNVENEFNAVNVNARFANEQLFLGRGAGSEPTASAVLSDVTAIHEDYKYTYAQSKLESLFTNDFYLKIVLSAEDERSLDEVEFVHVEKTSVEDKYVYKVGWVHFKTLIEIDFNKRADLFFAVLSEDFKLRLNEVKYAVREALV